MASTPDSWSSIPLDLAGLVLNRLPALVDRVRFAAVCPQWRSAALRLGPPPPLLALKAGDTFYSMPGGEPLRFAGSEPGFTTACGKWLVYQRSRDLLLVDPFSGATMTLPSPSNVRFPDEEESGGSRDGHDHADDGEHSENDDEHSEGSHEDSADEGDYYEDGGSDKLETLMMEANNFEVIKLVECSPNLFAALFQGVEFSKIAVCRPGGSKWSVAWGMYLWIADMAFYQEKLYYVDYDEDLLALDISVDDKTADPRISRIRRVINVNRFDKDRNLKRMLYLVKSCGSLLLVRRMIFHKHIDGEGQVHTFAGQCEPDVSIFKADFGRSRWRKVSSLVDNVALFLGPCSRDAWMPQGDSPGNRVWFLDDYKDFHTWDANNLRSGTSSVTNPRPFSPLPMISWRGYQTNSGAAWLFPSN